MDHPYIDLFALMALTSTTQVHIESQSLTANYIKLLQKSVEHDKLLAYRLIEITAVVQGMSKWKTKVDRQGNSERDFALGECV